jgi:hypothetical protein
MMLKADMDRVDLRCRCIVERLKPESHIEETRYQGMFRKEQE